MTGTYQLPADENERIFRDEIVPELLSGAQPQRRPLVVFIGGQTGAGKTAITQMVTRALGQRGGYINANMDFYTPHHPAYADLLAADETTASARVRPDTERWWVKAQRYAASQRYNVVIETALRSPAEFEDLVPGFRTSGYTVEAALLAVPEALSRLGILARYWREVADLGEGRLVDPAIHDECYQGVLRAGRAVEHGDLGDAVFAFRRNGHAVYSNTRDGSGRWAGPLRCVPAVQAERSRPWNAQERAWFDAAVTALRERIDPAWYPELQQIRALAQPLTGSRSLPALAASPQLSFGEPLGAGRTAHAETMHPHRGPDGWADPIGLASLDGLGEAATARSRSPGTAGGQEHLEEAAEEVAADGAPALGETSGRHPGR